MSTLHYGYQTQEFGEHDIHFRHLRDRQQFSDDEGEAEALGISSALWPLFGMVWQSGEVLAKLMVDYTLDDRRILEVGCGVGLASMVLNRRLADISATDIHPSAQQHLNFNTRLNEDRDIPFLRTAWEDGVDLDFGSFDLIIGSDVLYEPDHFTILADFIELYANRNCEVIVVEAGRGYGGGFGRSMEGHGYAKSQLDDIAPHSKPDSYRGKIWQYAR